MLLNVNRLLDMLVKTAEESDRSLIKDFLAGVDPTGGFTFSYGLRDAPVTKREQDIRRAVGLAGGLVGGALVVPLTVSGIIGAVKGATKGPTGLLSGFVKGVKDMTVTPFKAMSAANVLRKVEKGKAITPDDASKIKNFAELLPGMQYLKSVGKVTPEAEQLATSTTLSVLNTLPKDSVKLLRKKLEGEVNSAVATLAMSGIIGGTSAAIQYGKGLQVGRPMTPEQRRKATE